MQSYTVNMKKNLNQINQNTKVNLDFSCVSCLELHFLQYCLLDLILFHRFPLLSFLILNTIPLHILDSAFFYNKDTSQPTLCTCVIRFLKCHSYPMMQTHLALYTTANTQWFIFTAFTVSFCKWEQVRNCYLWPTNRSDNILCYIFSKILVLVFVHRNNNNQPPNGSNPASMW